MKSILAKGKLVCLLENLNLFGLQNLPCPCHYCIIRIIIARFAVFYQDVGLALCNKSRCLERKMKTCINSELQEFQLV